MNHHLREGWTSLPPGQETDFAKKRHGSLHPWADLPEADRAFTTAHVKWVLVDLLPSLGLRPRRPRGGVYQRVGEVFAEQLTGAETWRTGSNAIMRGSPGDWRVADEPNFMHPRTVANEVFRSRHLEVGENRFMRIGEHRADVVPKGTVVSSREGREVATGSCMRVTGPDGDQWLVPVEEFDRKYLWIRTIDSAGVQCHESTWIGTSSSVTNLCVLSGSGGPR